jgi:hypothetical protein
MHTLTHFFTLDSLRCPMSGGGEWSSPQLEEYRMDMVFFKAQADHATIRPPVTLLIEGTCR